MNSHQSFGLLSFTTCLLLQQCKISDSLGHSVVLQPRTPSAASDRDVGYTIFKQCVYENNFDCMEMSGEIGKDFQPLEESLFRSTYDSERNFSAAFFDHVDLILRKAGVRFTLSSQSVCEC